MGVMGGYEVVRDASIWEVRSWGVVVEGKGNGPREREVRVATRRGSSRLIPSARMARKSGKSSPKVFRRS